MKSPAFILALCALLACASAQPAGQPATVTLPATVVTQPGATGAPAASPAPAQAMLQPQPVTPPAPPSTAAADAQAAAIAKACPPIDEVMAKKYSDFFLLLRLVNMYTLQPTEPTPPLNATYEPITILVPTGTTSDFLRAQNIDIRALASDPLQSVLLAPTLAQHFVRGYWPANALPVANQSTLCGANCAQVNFVQQGDRVKVFSGNTNVTLVDEDVVNCPGRYVIHTVDNYMYTPVSDPLYAAEPALNLAYALGGKFDTFNLAGTKPGGRRLRS